MRASQIQHSPDQKRASGLARRACLAVAFSSLGILQPALGEDIAQAPAPQVVTLSVDGIATAMSPEEQKEQIAQAESVWAWLKEGVPQRFAPAGFSQEQLQKADRQLTVTVLFSGKVPTEMVVVAAPEEMWNEVPEALLPHYSVDLGEGRGKNGQVRVQIPYDARPWRLRAMANQRGSAWVSLRSGQRPPQVVLEPAEDHSLVVTEAGRDDMRLPKSTLRLYRVDAASRVQAHLGIYQGDEQGSIELRSVPVSGQFAATITDPTHAPYNWLGATAGLPQRVSLEPGTVVQGQIVLAEGQPVLEQEVRVSAWLGESIPETYHRKAISGVDGRWRVTGMPLGQVVATVKASGYALLRRTASASERVTDLGKMVLQPMTALRVQVVDRQGEALKGVRVSVRDGFENFTDAKGWAILEGLPREDLYVSVNHEGFLKEISQLTPPFPPEIRFELTQGFLIIGRYSTAEGTPVPIGKALLGFENEDGIVGHAGGPIEGDSLFRVLIPPGREATLYLTSPQARPVERTVAAGSPGEERDLGEILAPAGIRVSGTVVDAQDWAPVANARIWTTARSALGEMQSWFNGEVMEARSDQEGHFEVSGLDLGATLLRIDSPGYARVHVPLQPEPELPEIDLGQIEVQRGVQLEIAVDEPEAEGALAKVDLRGERLPFDQLTAMVQDGVATVFQVPPGRVAVSVSRDRKLFCETMVEIPPEEERVEVECLSEAVRMQGIVRVAGEAKGPGTLTWMPPAGGGGQVRSSERISAEGLRQIQTVSTERPPVHVSVRNDGTFFSREVSAGAWDVVWSPAAGGWFEPQRITVPEAREFSVALDFPGVQILGRVLDENGQGVAGARVWRSETGATDFSREDGSFTLSLAQGGAITLRAQAGDRLSPPMTLEANQRDSLPPVELILEEPSERTLEVVVLGPDERPVAGALVFAEVADSMGIRTQSSDATGRVRLSFKAPFPRQLRLAAWIQGMWVFQGWQSWQEMTEGIVLMGQPSGTVLISAEEEGGILSLQTPQGQDLSYLLTLTGNRPLVAEMRPLELRGLPEGTYRATLGQHAVSFQIREGEVSSLEFP